MDTLPLSYKGGTLEVTNIFIKPKFLFLVWTKACGNLLNHLRTYFTRLTILLNEPRVSTS